MDDITITGITAEENESGVFVENEDTLDDDERRRFIALDHAVRLADSSTIRMQS